MKRTQRSIARAAFAIVAAFAMQPTSHAALVQIGGSVELILGKVTHAVQGCLVRGPPPTPSL